MTDWKTKDNKLFNEYKFKDYNQALNFVEKISELAEKQNHHPDICFGWGYVNVSIFSHDTQSITQRDHDLAQAISEL